MTIPWARGGDSRALGRADLQQLRARPAGHSPRLWELGLKQQFQFSDAPDHAERDGRKGEQGTCPSSALGNRAGSSLSSRWWGRELGWDRVSGWAERSGKRPGWRKGAESWKGKRGLPGGRDKAELISQSL